MAVAVLRLRGCNITSQRASFASASRCEGRGRTPVPAAIFCHPRSIRAPPTPPAMSIPRSLTTICLPCATGLIQFPLDIHLDGISHSTTIDDWNAIAKLRPDGLTGGREVGRVQKMMEEYVRPRYLPHIKGVVEKCIRKLEAAISIAAGGPPPEEDIS